MPEGGVVAAPPAASRTRNAASRHVTSLRRSQRRMIGEEHPTGSADESPPALRAPTSLTDDDADAARSTRARLRASLLHPGRGQILAAIILFIVGAAGVMQFRINTTDDTYASARREDLIQLLDGLGAESRRLEGEIAQLEQTRSDLRSGADTQRVARAEAERHLAELSILAGTAPAEGRGIRMRIADPNAAVDAGVLLDAVEEMRDAGAEVIEVNNTIRVVSIDVVRIGCPWPGHRRQTGQSADHTRGHRGAARPGGGCPVSRRNRLRDHRTQDRGTGAARTSGPGCDRIDTRVERESVRSPCSPAANPSMM